LDLRKFFYFMLRRDIDYRIVSAKEFNRYFDESHEELSGIKYCYVDDRDEQDYEDCTCIMFTDADGVPEAYAAVDPSGIIGSVLKDVDSHRKAFLLDIMYVAHEYGGSKLDCYKDEESTLPYNYADAGFMPVCRIHFDRSQAAECWCDEAGTPDVVFMFLIEDDMDYESYRVKVLEDKYPRFLDYKYIPYAEDLFDRFPQFDHDNIYVFAEQIRDYVENAWINLDKSARGNAIDFVNKILNA